MLVHLVRALAVAAALAGLVATVDALHVSDAERVARLLEGLGGPLERRQVDEALAHVDLGREPVELVSGDGVERYESGEVDALAERVLRAVGPYFGASTRLVQRTVDVHGDDALLAVRLAVGDARADVTLRLRRHGDEWLVRRVRVL